MAEALHTGDDLSLYDRDFYTWTQDQAAALRRGRFKGLDLEHLAEEIEDWGKSERSAIESYAARILEHALKIGYWTWLGDRNARRPPQGRLPEKDRRHRLSLLFPGVPPPS
jgi:hypothetical protein